MAFTKISDTLNVHQSRANKPTETASELKVLFDQDVNTVKTRFNEFIDELEATTAADSIGVDALNVSAANVADAIAEVQANLATYVLGGISDNTLTNAKLVEDIKIGSLAALTTTEKASVVGAINELDSDVDLKAPLASPALTGAPTAPTAAADVDSTQIATTAFVKDQMEQSKAAGGYQYVNGMLFQWGALVDNGTSPTNPQTFTTTFPNACFGVFISINYGGASDDSLLVSTASVTTSGFNVVAPGSSPDCAGYWFAIGY